MYCIILIYNKLGTHRGYEIFYEVSIVTRIIITTTEWGVKYTCGDTLPRVLLRAAKI